MTELKGRRIGSERGRFESTYKEPRGEVIALRLPQSLDQKLRAVVGWQSKDDNQLLKDTVEKAIAQFLGEAPAPGIGSGVLKDAVEMAIATKRSAIAREKKRQGKADQKLIDRWLREITELEAVI